MHVVYTRLTAASEARLAQFAPTALPEVYRQRLADRRDGAARAQSVAGLLLLRALLDDDAAWHRIGFSATGRPEIAGGPWFSVSHSKRWVACALSRVAPIGLDIEVRRPDVSPRLVARIVPDGGDFFAAWCAREATVKASGRVGLARVRAITLGPAHARLDERDWPLRWLKLAPDVAGCVAGTPGQAADLAGLSVQAIAEGDLLSQLR